MVISVVIPSKNGLHHLKECLPTVIAAAKNSSDEVKIIVVDDCSDDNTYTELPKLFPEVICLRTTPENKGICSARNTGIRASNCDWVCNLDNDVFLEPDFFYTLKKYMREDVFAVSCCGYTAFPKVQGAYEQNDGVKVFHWKRGFPRFTENILNDKLDLNKEYECVGGQGAYFFVNRKWYDLLNGFDELYNPYMFDETDFLYRGLKRGGKIIYASDTKPRHKCGGTIQSKTNPFSKYLSKRNRIIFVWKNIHDNKLLLSNLFWNIINPAPKALFACLKMLPELLRKRKIERRALKVSDVELLKRSKDIEDSIKR